jgi:hypothetical protein
MKQASSTSAVLSQWISYAKTARRARVSDNPRTKVILDQKGYSPLDLDQKGYSPLDLDQKGYSPLVHPLVRGADIVCFTKSEWDACKRRYGERT